MAVLMFGIWLYEGSVGFFWIFRIGLYEGSQGFVGFYRALLGALMINSRHGP